MALSLLSSLSSTRLQTRPANICCAIGYSIRRPLTIGHGTLRCWQAHALPRPAAAMRRKARHVGVSAAAQQTNELSSAPSWLPQLVVTLLWPEGILEQSERTAKEAAAYVQMARPINLLPSCLLVFIGAWAGVGHTLTPLLSPAVWLMALLSGSVAVASCVVNDYFDLRTDTINAPHKPLPSGVVPPDGALLLASVLYIAVLIAACLMEPPLLRAIVAFSAAATLLYTPLLKRLTGVKTATVAAIIALSPLAGALAAGAGWPGVCATAAPAAFAFLATAHRETLMDLNDAAGDREAGVWTLPVVAGPRASLAAATALLAGAAAVAFSATLRGSGLAWVWAHNPGVEAWVRAACAAAMAAVVRPAFAALASIGCSGFHPDVVSAAVDNSLKAIGLGMLLTAALV